MIKNIKSFLGEGCKFPLPDPLNDLGLDVLAGSDHIGWVGGVRPSEVQVVGGSMQQPDVNVGVA